MRSTPTRLVALALALVMALGAAACGGGDDGNGNGGGAGTGSGAVREGGEATVNYPSFPDFLDPAMSYTVAGWQALVPTYTTLLTYRREAGESGAQLIPGLAEAMPEVTDDGRTYTFRLREGLQYSDGSPVRAGDFEHAIKRVITLESGGASFFVGTIEGAEEYLEAGRARGDISGIEADEDSREITIRLTEANGQFPFILTMPFAAPVPRDTPFEVLTRNPPPGVGQFTIENVEGSRRFDLVKNENYPEIEGLPAAKLDRITVQVVKNNERSIRDVLRNRADYMDDPSSGDALREFRERAPERYRTETTNSTYYFFLNQRVEPFDDLEVRKAVHVALDRDALERLYGGQLTMGCNFLPPGMKGYEQIDPCPFGPGGDVERARQMIRAAGAEGSRVTVWGNDESQTRRVTEFLADTMNEIGLRATPRIVDGEVWVQTVGSAETRAGAGFANWFQDFPHPGNFLVLVDPDAIQPTNNLNWSNVDDPRVAREIDRIGAMDLDEAAEGYAALDRRLVENVDVIPYGHRALPVFTSERIAFDAFLFHPVLQADFATLALKE
jgi:peptide/nickel transport system substrate-binding protein